METRSLSWPGTALDVARVRLLRENLIDLEICVDDARADVDRAVEQLRSCVVARNATAHQLVKVLANGAAA